jgi:hypothetical protein
MKPVIEFDQINICLISFLFRTISKMSCFFAIYFQLCFTTCTWEDPRKQDGSENE